MNEHIDKILNSIDLLKPISPTHLNLLSMINDSDTDLNKITDIVSHDVSIAANVLKMANSVSFARSYKTDSIHDAVAFLGLNRLYDIILLQVAAPVIQSDCPAYFQKPMDLWRHSVCSAYLSREVGAMIGYQQPNTLFTAALLKDIGKVVLQQFLPEQAAQISEIILNDDLPFNEAESKIVGIDHPEIGARVAEKWRLASIIVSAIRNHHNYGDPDIEKTTAIVQIGDYLISMMGIGTGIDGLIYRINPAVEDLLSDKQLQMAMVNFLNERDKLFTEINHA